MTDELKPCPFCGGEAIKYLSMYEDRAFVGCADEECKVMVRRETSQEAIDAWNRRAKGDE